MKTVYYCTGGCKGESDTPDVCGSDTCVKKGKPFTKTFKCEECGFHYEKEETAKKCEEWCKKYHSCHIEYTKEALENKNS